MKTTNDQKWIMFKEDWLITIQKLPLETQARFIQGLMTGEITEDVFANVLIEQHIQEFNRVNEYAQQARDLRKEKSKKAAEVRWGNKQQNTKECLSIPQEELKDTLSNASQCHTNTNTSTNTNIKTNTNKKESIINKVENIKEEVKVNNKIITNLGLLGVTENNIKYSDYYDESTACNIIKQKLSESLL